MSILARHAAVSPFPGVSSRSVLTRYALEAPEMLVELHSSDAARHAHHVHHVHHVHHNATDGIADASEIAAEPGSAGALVQG